MNDKLNKFIEEHIDLIDSYNFGDLFVICPRHLMKPLLELLQKTGADIIDQDVRYYVFRTMQNKIVSVHNYDIKTSTYTYNTVGLPMTVNNSMKFLIKDNLLDAINFAIGIGSELGRLQQSFIDQHPLEQINMIDGATFLVSKECVDFFNPKTSKQIRRKQAAQEEYKQRISELYKVVYNKQKLRSAMEAYQFDPSAYMYVSQLADSVLVDNLIFDKTREQEIKDTIIKLFNIPVDIDIDYTEHKIIVTAKGPRINKIKKEVEDMFGLTL